MDRPNILFIFADQLVYDGLGCTGSPDAITPHLDALAAGGVVCDAAYSSSPVCTPYRACLLTGRHAGTIGALRNEAPLPVGVPTLADALAAGGYATAYVGKWHLGGKDQIAVPAALRGGFQRFIGYQCYNDYIHDVEFFDEAGRGRRFAGNRTQATSDLAIEALDSLASGGAPWLLMASYQDPHYPLQPEPGYAALFHGRPVARRPNQREVEPFTPTWSPRSPRPVQRDPNWQRYGGDLDEYLRLYHAQVCQLDAEVGRVLARLRRLGLDDKTIVVFTSDHGDLQGMHGLVNKSSWHEGSARVPLLAAGPGIPPGTRLPVPVGCVEWLATCCDWAQRPAPEGVHAPSMRALLEGRSQAHIPVFSESGDWISVREGAWRCAASTADLTVRALHDLEADPYELHDRAGDPATAEIQARLVARLDGFRSRRPGVIVR